MHCRAISSTIEKDFHLSKPLVAGTPTLAVSSYTVLHVEKSALRFPSKLFHELSIPPYLSGANLIGLPTEHTPDTSQSCQNCRPRLMALTELASEP